MIVVLADDEAKVRSALRLIVEQEENVSVTEIAETTTLFALCQSSCPELVLLDWELPGMNAARLALLRAYCPQAHIIVMSAHPQVRQVLTTGGDLFICKSDSPAQFIQLLARQVRDLRSRRSNSNE
jgi:DNA-binding NarL/FixJ family response regulator